jgi:Rad3-related DNA helicase
MIKIIESPTGSGKTVWPACMGANGSTPADYGLPHDAWRLGQDETLGWIKRDMSGSVIALCRTKNLQAENYEATYGFDVLYGRSNYPCVHSKAPPGATAGDCRHQDNMYQCKSSQRCEYLVQKDVCKSSPMVALNYAYYGTAHWPKLHPPSVLFCDEAHQLPAIVLDKAGTTITHKVWTDWNAWAMRWNARRPGDKLAFIPAFPELRPGDGGGMFGDKSNPIDEATDWLVTTRNCLRQIWLRLARIATGKDDLKLKRRCENLGRKLTATINALSRCPDDWWIKSGQQAQKFKGKFRP